MVARKTADEIPAHQLERRRRIEAAAYDVLAEVGYRSASILAVARRARASNETLYQWYGNKQGLFLALVEANAANIRALLDGSSEGALRQAASAPGSPDAPGSRGSRGSDGAPGGPGAVSSLDTLRALGPGLIALVTSDRAVRLNRAAAADVDDTATLGPAIAAAGRDTILPLLEGLIGRLADDGVIGLASEAADRASTARTAAGAARSAAETYVSLLIGDWQIRRAIGVMAEPSPAQVAARAARALDQFLRLHPPVATAVVHRPASGKRR